jgi:hypothetical protein
MRKLFLFIFILSHCCIWSQNQKASVLIPGQYIVVLKESFAAPVVRSGLTSNRAANKPKKELRQQNNAKLKSLQSRQRINESAIIFDYTDAIVGFSAKLSDAEVLALQNDPSVEGVYQDHKIQLEQTSSGIEKKQLAFSQTEDCAITTAGGHVDGSSKFTWIWIMDTGIDTDHSDLNVQSHSPYAAWFAGNSFEDIHGHGTHVAGIAAAKDNNEGVVGISAGAKVVPVKVLNDGGSGSISTLIVGLDHIAQYSIPGDVVNMSLGFPESCSQQTALSNAMINLANAGVWICVAAGNYSENTDFTVPACFNYTRVFTVAAIDCQNHCASFTNLGSSVDWYAVGVDVYSTYLNGGYTTLSGTSMATPVVAGIVHARGQAPIRGPEITCQLFAPNITTIKPLARRQ